VVGSLAALFFAMHATPKQNVVKNGRCRTSFQGSGAPMRRPQLPTNGTADIAY